MTFTKEEAKASDRILAALTSAYWSSQDRCDRAVDALHRLAGDHQNRRTRTWLMTEEQVRERVVAVADDPGKTPWERDGAGAALRRVEAAASARDAAAAAVSEHEAQWRDNGRWSRFFVVAGGHIHQSRSCHSLRPTTRLGWLPELSGESEAEAVAIHGAVLCSHCFVSAPTEWTSKGRSAEVDPSVCSGRSIEPGSFRGQLRGGWGFCSACGARVTVTSVGIMCASTRGRRRHRESGSSYAG